MPPQRWCSLIATMMTLHDQQRETSLDKRRGHCPRLTAPGTGRRPLLTLADRLLATALHQHLAASRHCHPVRRPARDDRHAHPRHPPATGQAGHAIQPGPHRLASLEDLSHLAAAEGAASADFSSWLASPHEPDRLTPIFTKRIGP